MSDATRALARRIWLAAALSLAACTGSIWDTGSEGKPPAGPLAAVGGGASGTGGAPANGGQPGAGGAAAAPSGTGGGAASGGSDADGSSGAGGADQPAEAIFAYFDFSAGDSRGYSGDGDFSPGRWKGECGADHVMTGLSSDPACVSPKVLQCESGRSWASAAATVHPNCADARRDDSTGDWDVKYLKGECGASEAVVGISRDGDGAVYDLLCADVGVSAPGACDVRNVNAGDNRGRSSTGDWAPKSWKAECSDGQYVKGVSLDAKTRHPHAILCCSGSGTASVTAVTNPETPETGSCNRSGTDANVTVFDKAHLTGSARYVYKTVTFPEQGTYEKITMTLTLGCPANGCDPWDRWGNVSIVLDKHASDPGGDQVLELGRFVTPYGVGGTFTYDLTALRPALSGQKQLRIFTDTWVDGWLATVKIEMKGGAPAREPSFVLPLWTALHVGVGASSHPVSLDVPPRQVTVPQSSCGLGVRAIITGHGQGNRDNCAEFCAKTHYFKVEGQSHGQSVWRDDCATTAVQNQNGTWQYARAGWCPGAGVRAFSLDVGGDVSPEAKAGKTSFSVAYELEGYDNTCRPDSCNESSCVFDTGCAYDNGLHTEPYYALSAVLIGYR